MKLTLDLPSVAAGGVLAILVAVVVGFSPQTTQVPPATNRAPNQATGFFQPHPDDFVWIDGFDQPFTVPAGKTFVLTSIGHRDTFDGGFTGYVYLFVDWVPGTSAEQFSVTPDNPDRHFGDGRAFGAGTILDVSHRDDALFPRRMSYATGYWADA